MLDAKQSDSDPYAAIESIISWDDFQQSIIEAEQLAKPASFDHLHLMSEQFSTLRRYTPEFMDVHLHYAQLQRHRVYWMPLR